MIFQDGPLDPIKIKLKKCCLTCEHFDPRGVLGFGMCASSTREIACGHMEVCAHYAEESNPLITNQDGWISVKERLPDANVEFVLAACFGKFGGPNTVPFLTVAKYSYVGDCWLLQCSLAEDYRVTHWQFLPKFPEE